MSADKYLSTFSHQMATIVYIFPNFQNCTRCEIDLKDTKHNSLYLVINMLVYFVLGHYLFLEAHFLEQIMSEDKCPNYVLLYGKIVLR